MRLLATTSTCTAFSLLADLVTAAPLSGLSLPAFSNDTSTNFTATSVSVDNYTSSDLARRGIATLLSAEWGPAGHIYLSTHLYDCGPYPLAIFGRYPPFDIAVVNVTKGIDLRTNPDLPVLAELGGGWPAGNVSYAVDQPKGTLLALRVTDSEGNVAYSSEKVVKDGKKRGKWMCKATKAGKRKERARDIGVGFGCFSPALLFFAICLYFCLRALCRRRAARRGRQQQAIPLAPRPAAAVRPPAAAQPVRQPQRHAATAPTLPQHRPDTHIVGDRIVAVPAQPVVESAPPSYHEAGWGKA